MKLSEQRHNVVEELFAPTNVFDLLFWAKDYERNTPFPCDLVQRYMIGLYQIHQGMSWEDGGVNKYESYAASTLHFLMVAAKEGLPVEQHWDGINIEEFRQRPMSYLSGELLQNISAGAQQLVYASKANKTKRKGRYSSEKLCRSLSRTIELLLKIIPVHMRQECFEKASLIMTKELK